MEYRELGRTGLRVSEIGLGCEGFVGKTEEETQALMTQAVEAGVNSSCCRRICVPSGRTASTKPRGTSARYGLPLRTCCAVWKQTISTWE